MGARTGKNYLKKLAASKLHVQVCGEQLTFITHHHSGHNADAGNLLLLGWPGLTEPVPVIGPPPLNAVIKNFLEANRYDIDIRTQDKERPGLDGLIEPRDLRPGVIHADDRVRASAALSAETWRREAQRGYSGRVIVGDDLMRI